MKKNPERSKRQRAGNKNRNKRGRDRRLRNKRATKLGRNNPRPGKRKNRRRQEKAGRLWDGCSGKKRFDDLEKAKRAALSMIQRNGLATTGVYPCRSGAPHYHVTTKPGADCVLVLEVTDGP